MISAVKKTCNFFPPAAVKSRCKAKILLNAVQDDQFQGEKDKQAGLLEFSQIFDEYFDKIYQFFYFRLRNREDSEDLAAMTFEKVFKNLDSYSERGHGIAAWIYTIARNVLNDFFRKKKLKKDCIDDLPPSKMPSEDFDLKSLDIKLFQEHLWEAIKNLPEKQQMVWSLKLTEDLPHKIIAEVLETTEANVNVMIHRSLKLLKQQLQHLNDQEG
jgi:RNA polymerase sigma factor (sigma-70 family)